MIANLNEESAKEKIGWCGGRIEQMATFGHTGLIIEPSHSDLVKIAWNCDLGSPAEQDDLRQYIQTHRGKIRYPLLLLTKTIGPEGLNYNELILQGDEKTLIRGVFSRFRDSKTSYEASQLREVVGEVTGNNVPLIELPEIVLKRDYDNISDPDMIKKSAELNSLSDMCRTLQVHGEFYNPQVFGNGSCYEEISFKKSYEEPARQRFTKSLII